MYGYSVEKGEWREVLKPETKVASKLESYRDLIFSHMILRKMVLMVCPVEINGKISVKLKKSRIRCNY